MKKLAHLLKKQEDKIKALINGNEVEYISEIFLLIFGDFKKHLFNYQFFSVAQAVENYEVLNWNSA